MREAELAAFARVGEIESHVLGTVMIGAACIVDGCVFRHRAGNPDTTMADVVRMAEEHVKTWPGHEVTITEPTVARRVTTAAARTKRM